MATKQLNSAKAKEPAKTAEVQPEVRQSKTDELFRLVKNKDGVRISVGNYQISRRVFKSWQQAEDYLRQKPFEIIINVACLSADETIKQHEKVK